MMKVKSKFNDKQLAMMKRIGIELQDDKDYSDDELLDFHEMIVEYPYDHRFDEDGEPTELGLIFESLIDVFHKEFDI